ncbi:sigma-54 dependent transcriptional regulator [Desulfurispirillum indicum]|nr:sigma-54 dependent transcriptional regulator [Desulfurispirillum indicum]UCZ56485.1 sigma-54 dependent transcriptional regulator [Desulfurispirillum indicum]
MSIKILIVDDEAMQRQMLEGFLLKQGFEVLTAANAAQALEIFQRLPVHLVLLDHRMPDMNGDQLLAELKAINPLVRAIMVTAYGAVDMAVEVMKLGAVDFLEKPVDLTQLLGKLQELAQDIVVSDEVQEVNAHLAERQLPMTVAGDSPPMRQLLSMVRRIAPSPWTVLIHGETGTGKELFANLIHQLSDRSDGPFVALNCAAIPENLFESELFGHEKGAFTGAISRKRGRFEQARGGTLFLDEVGELPLAMQAKLLRVLQEKRISRVGGEEEIAVDVRLIAATNRNLLEMSRRGDFREDLYYRLNVLELEIPPLRHRREDIPAFVDFFLRRFGMEQVRFSAEALNMLVKYPFPGNVRELEHLLQRTVTLARGKTITPADLPPEIVHYSQQKQSASLDERLADLERHILQEALQRHDWVQIRAAQELGISERVLRYRMARLRILRQ